jgi:hypothetical protein
MHGRMQLRFVIILALLLIISRSVTSSSAQNPSQIISGTTERVSVATDSTQGNNSSEGQSISTDGRFVAFDSTASNLVSGDTNNSKDVFVHDRQNGTTERVSVASDGTQGNGYSSLPSISADGRLVAFGSYASNLVSGDTNANWDVFVHDRQTGTNELVSVASNGIQGNNGSEAPSITADGRFVAFISDASNLVSGDTNNATDVFVHDRQTGTTERVSVGSNGTQGNNSISGFASISADERFIAFVSYASNLVSGDTNNTSDVFVHDRQTGITERVSVASDGTQGNSFCVISSISADGRFVAFESNASNLVSGDTNNTFDVFVHDHQSGITERVSISSDGTQGNNDSGTTTASISADGRFVALDSTASNLVSGDTNNASDVFVHDRQTGTTERVSIASDGTQGNNWSSGPSISPDGRFLAFESTASNLVIGDTNGYLDVFVHDRGGSSIYSISGQITLPFGSPFEGVTVEAGSYSAITDDQGNYIISNVSAGTYTVVPRPLGYYFKPSSRTVSVPPDASGINFIGKERVKLKLLIVPLNWHNTQDVFNTEAQSHIDDFLNQLPLNNCRYEVVEDILDVNTQNFNNFTCSPPQGTATSSIRTFVEDVLKIDPTDFDIIIGLTETTPCPPVPGGSNGSISTLWTSLEFESVTAHELGHIFNLTDEYCSNQAGSTDQRCNDGDIQGDGAASGDINWLDATLPCDCPPDGSNDSGGSPCCNFGGNNCSQVGYPGICCLGNKIGNGNGRSIMSYANAPDPRLFDIHDLSHLSGLPKLNCGTEGSDIESLSQGLSEDEEQLIVDIDLFLHPDDIVTDENISIHYGRPTSDSILSGKTGDYSFKIIDDDSNILWKQDFSVYFDYMGPVVLGEDYSGITYDTVDVSMQIPQSCSMSELQLYHNEALIFSDTLSNACTYLPISLNGAVQKVGQPLSCLKKM